MKKRIYMTLVVDIDIDETMNPDVENAVQDYCDNCIINIESQRKGVETYDAFICETNY